jgi:hypothetical protein
MAFFDFGGGGGGFPFGGGFPGKHFYESIKFITLVYLSILRARHTFYKCDLLSYMQNLVFMRDADIL